MDNPFRSIRLMTEVELFPALDKLGRPIPQHYDVWLNGEVFVKAVVDPLAAASRELLRLGIPSNGVCIKPRVIPPTTTTLDHPRRGRVFTPKKKKP